MRFYVAQAQAFSELSRSAVLAFLAFAFAFGFGFGSTRWRLPAKRSIAPMWKPSRRQKSSRDPFAFTFFMRSVAPTSGENPRTAPEPEGRGSDMLIRCAVSTVVASCHLRCERGCVTAMLHAVHRHSESVLEHAARLRKARMARMAHCHRRQIGVDPQQPRRWMQTLVPNRNDIDANLDEPGSA